MIHNFTLYVLWSLKLKFARITWFNDDLFQISTQKLWVTNNGVQLKVHYVKRHTIHDDHYVIVPTHLITTICARLWNLTGSSVPLHHWTIICYFCMWCQNLSMYQPYKVFGSQIMKPNYKYIMYMYSIHDDQFVIYKLILITTICVKSWLWNLTVLPLCSVTGPLCFILIPSDRIQAQAQNWHLILG